MYKPDKKTIRINPITHDRIIKDIDSGKFNNHIIDENKDNTFFQLNIDKMCVFISQMCRRYKVSKFGISTAEFSNSINYINNIPNDNNIKFIPSALISLENMHKNNFHITFVNTRVLEKYTDNFVHIIGIDSVFKYFKNENTIYIVTTMDENNHSVPFALAIASNDDGFVIGNILNDIIKYISDKLVLNIKPTVMIDNCAKMKRGVKNVGLNYVLCKFHLLRAFRRNIAQMGYSDKTFNDIIQIIKEIYLIKNNLSDDAQISYIKN